MVVAAVFRADFVLTLLYLFVGLYVGGCWWSRRAIESVKVHRDFPRRIFLGEPISVRLELANLGRLPVVWLEFQESLPVELRLTGILRQVVSLAPRGRTTIEYQMQGRKRGYYQVGPLTLRSGDLFGLGGELVRSNQAEALIVYPKIVPISRLPLPSHSPVGALRTRQPIFEDPARQRGKRDYTAGDSLRRVDWKATAASGRLQVKLFEPSIALETAIFLDLDSNAYSLHSRYNATELGIVAAASIANYITTLRQPVGLMTNGSDPLGQPNQFSIINPDKGRGHLMRILDLLARVQVTRSTPLPQLLSRQRAQLSWGTTLILISPRLDEALFDCLFGLRRAGLLAMLVPCGPLAHADQVRLQAEHFGFPFRQIFEERDLERWL